MKIFSICLGFLALASQMLTGACDSVEETFDFMHRAQSELKLRNNEPNITLVIGNTGSDISTLVQYIAGDYSKLVSIKSKADENEHDGQDSKSLVSEMVVDEAGNVWYECPGFADTPNETVEIVKTILGKTVIENASRVKIVLVTNYASDTNDHMDLDRLLTHAVKLITDIDRFKNSIALVVSTMPSGNTSQNTIEDSVKNATVEYLRNHRAILEGKGSSEQVIQLIDNLLGGAPNEEHPKISIFWHPDGASPMVVDARQKIRKSVLEDTSYTEIQPNDFGFPLTDRALIHLQNMSRLTFANISIILTSIDRCILNALQLKIKSSDSFYDRLDLLVISKSLLHLNNESITLKQLTDEFSALNEALNLTSINTELNRIAQHERNVNSLTSIAKTGIVLPIRDWIANASKTFEYLASEQNWYSFLVRVYEFFASYDAQKNIAAYNVANLADWGRLDKPQGLVIDASNFNKFSRKFSTITEATPSLEKLVELNEIIDFALQFPSQYECSREMMTIRGNFVKSSDIKPWKCGSVSKITVYVVHTFFVDNNLNLSGYKELKIYADKWIVLQEATFNLNGFDGEAQSRPRSPGMPGRRGNSGTNAGNFFGLSREMVRGHLLTINANGGNGATGQDGTASDDVEPTFTRTRHEDSGMALAIPSPHEYYRRFLKNEGYDAELTHSNTWFKNVMGMADDRVIRNRFRIHPKKCCGKTGLGGPGGAGGLSGNYIFIQIGNNTYSTPMFNLNDGLHGRKGADAEPCKNTALDIIVNTYVQRNVAFIVQKYSFKSDFLIESRMEDIRCRTRYEYTTMPVPLPSPRVSLDFISSIIEYKTFLRGNMKNSLVEITYTYDAINSNPDISQAYKVVDFVAELTSLEKQFNELKQYVDLMSFYDDLLKRIENYATTFEEKHSDQEVFALLYSTILSRTLSMRSGYDSDLIIDIDNFFDIIIDNVHKLDETARLLMIEEHRTKYNEGINATIDEAMSYVENDVRPEIKKLFFQLDIEMREALDETMSRQANTKEELKSKLGNSKIIRRYAMLRKMADIFGVTCELVPFLSTRGKIIGNLINIGVSIRTNAMVDPEVVDIELPAGVTRVQNELDEHLKTNVRNRIDSFESELRKLNDSVSGKGFDKFDDQLNTLISLGRIIQLKNPLVNDDINKLFDKFSEFVNKQQKELATVDGTAEILERLEETANVLVVIETSISMYRQFLNKNERLDAIGRAINADRSALIALKVLEAEIVAELVPMINGLQHNIDDVQRNLDGKSLVALDVQQWKVHETLRSVERKLQQAISGFKNEFDVENCLITICEAFNLIVNIYDRIQNYQDQSKLVTYLSDLQSDGRRHLRVHNVQLEDLQFNLQANIILSQYNRAIEAFKQAAFPFAAKYLDMYQLPASLSVDKNISMLIAAVADRTESLSARMKELNTTVINEDDGRIHLAYFDRDSAGIQPFYVWPNNEVKNKLRELFDGNKIYLMADVKRSSRSNAIKFNIVDLQFHSSNRSINVEINRILQSFHVSLTHMGESNYRCNEQFYTINSRPQTIKYSFGKRNQEPVDRSVVYDKLRSGVKLLSPYTLWAIQLSRGPFGELKSFVNLVDIELHGTGQYVNDGAAICNTDLGKYYSHMNVL